MKTEIEGYPRRGNPASRHLHSIRLCAAFYTRYEPCQRPRRLSPGDAPSPLISGRLRESMSRRHCFEDMPQQSFHPFSEARFVKSYELADCAAAADCDNWLCSKPA